MKKLILLFIIITATIVSTLQFCKGGDDSFSHKKDTIPQIPIDTALTMRIDSFVTSQKPVGILGLSVFDITAEREIYTCNDTNAMRPASCLKLLTCIATLKKVGAAYKYRTRLYSTGKLENDTLYGDIILKTQFDPAFNRDSLYTLINKIKEKGIKAIKGKVALDMAFTEPMNHEEHWTIGDLKTRRMGLIYQGYNRMRNETLYALHSICGIRIKKEQIAFGRLVPKQSTLIAETCTSIKIPIEKALMNSSNINAESLLYLLGYTTNSKGNFRENGRIALKTFIEKELKISNNKEYNIEDGCGLCPDNRLSPKLLITLLNYAHKHSHIYDELLSGLPKSGNNGTLYDRMYKPHIKGMLQAKTGTLTRENGISTLAGYFKHTDGHLIAFAIMNNECPVMDGRWWQDRLCERAFITKTKK